MKAIHQIIRLFYIQYILAKYGIDRVVLNHPRFSNFRFLSHLNPWNWSQNKKKTSAESVRLALEQLGPIFVKFGQLLSTRHDMLSEEMIVELSKLQDRVPPFSSKKAQIILETALKASISDIFSDFSVEPLASASIAQVHTATLKNGQQVVVKIRRPRIEKLIRRDVGLLYFVATLGEWLWSHGRRLRLRAVVKEFETTLWDELDFLREAANASQLARNFEGSPLLHVPEAHWEYTTSGVFVMERIFGLPISDIERFKAEKVDLKLLAERGVEIFFTQVFRDSFFHADMHPGNVFVSIDSPQNPYYMAVDFGIMGSLSPFDQHYLAENLLAFFNRDYRRVAILHVESGWVPHGTRIEAFEAAIRSVCEPIFSKPLQDISFAQLLLRLFQTAGRFNMEVQPQLFLLQKTLFNIEALGRQLYPELDLWATAKPFLERWMRKRYKPSALLKQWIQQGPQTIDALMNLPKLCQEVLRHTKEQQMVRQEEMLKAAKQRKQQKILYGLILIILMGVLWWKI